jgi:hypothetical protein
MIDGVVIALISGFMALLGVLISQLFEYLKRRSEERRWYADYFLPKKFNAIHDLYAQLQTTYGITIYRNRKLKNEDEYQTYVVKEVNELTRRFHLANIYLPEDVNKKIENFKKLITDACLHIYTLILPLTIIQEGKEKNVKVDWPENLESTYLDAKKALGKRLTPSLLKDLEKSNSENS